MTAQATEIVDTGVKELQSCTARASSVFTKEDKSIHKFTHTPTAKSTDNSSKVKECYHCGAKHNPDQLKCFEMGVACTCNTVYAII